MREHLVKCFEHGYLTPFPSKKRECNEALLQVPLDEANINGYRPPIPVLAHDDANRLQPPTINPRSEPETAALNPSLNSLPGSRPSPDATIRVTHESGSTSSPQNATVLKNQTAQ